MHPLGPVSHIVVNQCLRVDYSMNAVRNSGSENVYITVLVKQFRKVHFFFNLSRGNDKALIYRY